MALFSKKPNSSVAGVDEKELEIKPANDVVVEKEEVTPSFSMPEGEDAKSYGVILHPHITEKATLLNSQNKYTFKVSKTSNKIEIARAIEKLYKVKVEKVTIVNLPSKTKRIGKNEGQRGGLKKATVTLRKGDKIESAA